MPKCIQKLSRNVNFFPSNKNNMKNELSWEIKLFVLPSYYTMIARVKFLRFAVSKTLSDKNSR